MEVKIINISTFRFILYSAFVCIVLSALFFPAHHDGLPQFIYDIGNVVADIRAKQRVSEFPAALTVTYVMALFFAVMLAVLMFFVSGIVGRAHYLRLLHGRKGGLLIAIAAILLALVIIFIEMKAIPNTRADWYFSAVAKNRIFLAFWCGAIFILFFSAFAISAAAIVNFFTREENK